jgi:sulfhydrogenase subunit beta (sulfur reductase)
MSREETKLLRKERLEAFVEGLLQDSVVFAPVARDGLLILGRVESSLDLALGHGNTVNSAKDALFPQAERLFTFRRGATGVTIDGPSGTERDLVLFGIRPCDARGLLLLDGVFGKGAPDPYYAEKRARTTVITAACDTPDPVCFCLAVGGGPCSTEGSDLLFTDLGDRYLFEAGSRKGVALLRGKAFEDADGEAVEAASLVKREAEGFMDRPSLGGIIGADVPLEKRLEGLFDDPLWNDFSETCIECGICTYLCPTCYCFDICDEAGPSTGERIRIWDSCQFPLFTGQASGFNPRPTSKERFRQRIMHKFCHLPKSGNLIGCVGCGRCVTECPVNLDIREVIEKLSQAVAE